VRVSEGMIIVFDAPSMKPSDATYKALKQANWKPKQRAVFLKPNVGATSKRANTDPEVVRGIIQYVRELGVDDIIIGEGAVVTEYESTNYNYRYCGWDKLAEEEQVQLVDLNTAERVTVPWDYGNLAIPKLMVGRSYVNIAKMKTHMQTLVSLCLKNQKGLLNYETRKRFHSLGLHEPIARLGEVIQPELCVVDAIWSLEGSGPGDLGTAKSTNLIIVGSDMIEVDLACCSIMGIDPSSVRHINQLQSKGKFNPRWPSYQFKYPRSEFKMFRVHMQPHPTACTACLSSVGKLNKLARRSWRGRLYFIRHGLLSRLDIIVGNPNDLPKNHGFCVFYGTCASEIARKHPEYPFIQGCPPISKDALEKLMKF
jgi:uncharacterized protein (DUF362 family)